MALRGAPEGRFDRRLLAPMLSGSLMNPINSAILAVALAPIGMAFGTPVKVTVWLVTSLYLTTAVGQPLVGRLVDIFGAKRLYLAGAGLVVVGGAMALVAPNIWVLVAARVVLGLGTCAAYPATMHLIKSEAHRTGVDSPARVLMAVAITTQTVSVFGPTLGGLLIAVGGWQATFLVNIPLGLLSFVLGLLFMPRRTGLEPPSDLRPRVDWLGTVLFTGMMLGTLMFLLDLRVDLLWLLGVGIVFGVAFVWWELRDRQPFIDLRLLAGNGPLLLTFLRTMLTMTVSYAFSYGFSQWLEDGYGLDPTAAGLLLLPAFGIGVVASAVSGRNPKVRGKLLVGSIAQIVAGVSFLLVDERTPFWLLFLPPIALGLPYGLNILASQNALYYQADPARIASSAGLQRTFMYLGAIAASVAIGLFYGETATTSGMHELGWLVIVVAVVFLGITVFDRSLARIGAAPPRDIEPLD